MVIGFCVQLVHGDLGIAFGGTRHEQLTGVRRSPSHRERHDPCHRDFYHCGLWPLARSVPVQSLAGRFRCTRCGLRQHGGEAGVSIDWAAAGYGESGPNRRETLVVGSAYGPSVGAIMIRGGLYQSVKKRPGSQITITQSEGERPWNVAARSGAA